MTQWKLVPVEPTDEMFFSGCEVQGSEYINVNKLWAAMLNAAPQTDAKPVGKFAKFTDGVWREVTKGSPGVLLYTHPPAADVQDFVSVLREVLNLLGPDAPECCGCRYEWQKAIDLIKTRLGVEK